MFFVPAIFLTFIAVLVVLLPLAKGRAVFAAQVSDKKILLRRRIAAIAALVFIPAFSAIVYAALGSHDRSDMPLALRKEAALEQADLPALFFKLETRLQQEPDDAQGWRLLADNYRLAGRPADAVKAYEKLIALRGENVETLLDLGEAMLEARQGKMDGPTEHVFVKILEKDSRNAEARFLIARFKAQKNDRAGALTDLKNLLADVKNVDVWRRIVEAEIARLGDNETSRPGS